MCSVYIVYVYLTDSRLGLYSCCFDCVMSIFNKENDDDDEQLVDSSASAALLRKIKNVVRVSENVSIGLASGVIGRLNKIGKCKEISVKTKKLVRKLQSIGRAYSGIWHWHT